MTRRFRLRSFPSVDPVTRHASEILVGRKDSSQPGTRASPPTQLTGYAYHLSRKAGRKIVFCLDSPHPGPDSLPVETVTGESIGHVEYGPYHGERMKPVRPWEEGFSLPPRATFALDPNLRGGIYQLGGTIPFVHRGHDAASLAVLIPSNTATAFNNAGGRRMYPGPDAPSADVLSFHRPLRPYELTAECAAFVRWFWQANPRSHDTAYLTDLDLEEPKALDGVEVLIVIGRSEFWTRKAREHFDAFVERGGRALLLCSELMYWQVRVNLAQHQLFRYKHRDPHPDPMLRTARWHDPSLRYAVFPRTGCDLAHGGYAATDEGIGWDGMRIVCPDSPFLAGSGLAAGDVVRLPDGAVWDGAPVRHGPGGALRVEFGDSAPWRHEVIGYNHVKPSGASDETPLRGRPATSLWMALRHTPKSGTVVHGGTMGWCGRHAVGGHGPDSRRIQGIVLHTLGLLLDDAWPFSFAGDDA